jgi:hypothetical protein
MKPPNQGPSLTPQMEAVLERMRRTQSVSLVRVGSQWWAVEADAEGSQAWGEVDGKFRPLFPAFQTSTVAGLVERRVLRLKGPKRKTAWPPHTPAHFRAGFRYG